MHVKVKTSDLLEALQPAIAASAQSAGGLVELKTLSGELGTRGTDGELFVRRSSEVEEVRVEGSATLAGRALFGLVRESGGGTVVLERKEQKLIVRSSAARYELLCASSVTLPEPPSLGKTATRMEAALLAHLFEMTSFAASSKEMRYAMNGVCLSARGRKVTAVATDGRRLALARATLKEKLSAEIIIPLRAVAELTRLLTGCAGEDKVELFIDEKFILLRSVRSEVAARLVEGRFPAYDEVVPRDSPIVASVPREELVRAMKSVPFLSSDEYQAARMAFSARGVTVEFGSPERGQGRVRIQAECTGGEVTVSLNPTFVLDVLRVLSGEKVRVALRDAESAVAFEEGEEFVYVVMPISPREEEHAAATA